MPDLESDFREYDSPETIRRYRRTTAGEGIGYLLRTTYGPMFLDAAMQALADTRVERLRAVEFGCGAGMAIHYLTECLREQGVDVDLAVGADFVPAMIEAARQDLAKFGTSWARDRLRYVVATNEGLATEMARGLRVQPEQLRSTFHLAIGVNTFRYPIRHGTASQVVEQLDQLLSPGARVVIIDMNGRFPYGIKPKRRTVDDAPHRRPVRFGTDELPSLDEYAGPFAERGFEILRKDYLAWIPHSANGLRFQLARAASGALDRLAPTRAMRSLVIARKPV